MSQPFDVRRAGRTSISLGSLGLMAGAAIAYFHHVRAGQVLMFVGAALLILGTILLANVNPPTGGSDAG